MKLQELAAVADRPAVGNEHQAISLAEQLLFDSAEDATEMAVFERTAGSGNRRRDHQGHNTGPLGKQPFRIDVRRIFQFPGGIENPFPDFRRNTAIGAGIQYLGYASG